jgi:hypothetical protein
MPHNHYHQNAERKSDGKIVSIKDRDVPSGKKCDCICTKCKEPLVAKKGKERVHHFAHANETNCKGETLAHIEAKNIIEKEGYLWLPRYIGEGDYDTAKVDFDEVDVEKLIDESDYRADLICKTADNRYVVEIVVTHDLDDGKELYLVQKKVDTISIDLKSVLKRNQYNDIPANFSELVLEKSNRKWVYNHIDEERKREEEEIKRRKEEKRLKQVERENRIKGIKQAIAECKTEIERKEKSKTLPMLKPINIINKEILDLMDIKFEKETELQILQEQQHLND